MLAVIKFVEKILNLNFFFMTKNINWCRWFASGLIGDLFKIFFLTIENNVSLGSYSMIFAHSNPTANLFLKQNGYPRVVKPVLIKEGAVINPGTIITAGVTIGKNSMISVGSVVSRDVPDFSVVAGNPARVIKKIDHWYNRGVLILNCLVEDLY